jgi:hypothetical protein
MLGPPCFLVCQQRLGPQEPRLRALGSQATAAIWPKANTHSSKIPGVTWSKLVDSDGQLKPLLLLMIPLISRSVKDANEEN